MRTITVEVTQVDVCEGVRCRADCCPVALALNRTTGGKWHVGNDCATDLSLFGSPYLRFPETLAEWTRRFDRKEEVQPITFTLHIPWLD